MMMQLMNQLMTNQPPTPPNPMTPWRFGDPKVLQQDLKDAGFSVVTCTPFSHPMKYTWADLVTFLLGPHGQLRPMLTKPKSDGRSDVDEEAEEVRFPWSQIPAVHTASCLTCNAVRKCASGLRSVVESPSKCLSGRRLNGHIQNCSSWLYDYIASAIHYFAQPCAACWLMQRNYSEASPDKRLRVKLLRLERSRMSTSVESAMPAEQQEQALNITVAKFFNLTTLPTGGYTHRIWKEGTSTRLVEYCAAQG